MPKADDDDLMLGSEDDDEMELDESDMEEEQDSSDDEALSLVEGSDNEDLIAVDDIPMDGLVPYDGSDSSESEWGGIEPDTKKRKRGGEEKAKRKKRKALPTFASYEDYAKLIEEGPEDDI